MTERQMQFRVGLFTIMSIGLIVVMVFKFGQLEDYWEKKYALQINFSNAGGVYPGTPIKRNGIQIGEVSELKLQEHENSVAVLVHIAEKYRLSDNVQPRIVRTLLGSVTIEITGGGSQTLLEEGMVLNGAASTDPLKIINTLEQSVTKTLTSFSETSKEWQSVGKNVNSLLEQNDKNISHVIVQSSQALEDFSLTMKNMNSSLEAMNQTIANPQNQENLRRTLASMPKLVSETEQTIKHIRFAVGKAEGSLANIETLTTPLAHRSNDIALNLDGAASNLNSLTGELNRFSKLVNKSDGSLQQFVTNPTLYRNLDQSSQSVTLLLNNLAPALRDIRIFTDKVAAHPELLGVSGVFKGSSGVKEAPQQTPTRSRSNIRQAGGTKRYRQNNTQQK